MPSFIRSYLSYARGEKANPLWALINGFGPVVRCFTRLRNAFYDRGIFPSTDPPMPVVSVGNLCHGGTNKTPMVEMLSRELTRAGLSVGIISRGYGGETREPLWIGQSEGSSRREVAGDEPLMLASRLPEVKVVISRERSKGVRLLAKLGADVVVADDAFQHRRMGRDLDIVLIDAACPFGNGRVLPSGILREGPESLRRADIVILTKVEQADEESLAATKKTLSNWLLPEDIFTARVCLDSWLVLENGVWSDCPLPRGQSVPEGRHVAFSAIANPASFKRSLESFGADIIEDRVFRDHHRFSWGDLDDLERRARELGADGFVCTEKDMHNLPKDASLLLPLYVPRITVKLDDPENFWKTATRKLRPNLVVASNGYGEDAMGAVLANLLRKRFPGASVSAFSLVGSGKEYSGKGVPVLSPPSEMPSGGVVHYSLKALAGDFLHGLRKDIGKQILTWRRYAGKFRTPLCVGDGYLLAHTVWGQGMTPLLVATAKSVRLNAHWALERVLLRRRCLRVWTRDEDTALALQRKGVPAVFAGSPIMDLAIESDEPCDPWAALPRPRVLLLAGSRPRAYDDITLLLRAVDLLNEEKKSSFLMVIAPTIDRGKLFRSPPCVRLDGENLLLERGAWVRLYDGSLVSAARGADILIGLGGTANQVSAGLGVPVVSILERGKLSQKKLLQDAEILVPADAESLASAAAELLDDPLRRNAMSEAGVRCMGGPGALASVAEYAAGTLGWDLRLRLYKKLCERFSPDDGELVVSGEAGGIPTKEAALEWKRNRKTHTKLMRLVRILKEK